MTKHLQPKEAAALAGISKVALWKAWKRGDISPLSISPQGVPTYERENIKAWLKRRTKKADLGPTRGGVRIKATINGKMSEIPNPLIAEIVYGLRQTALTKEKWLEIHSKCVAAKLLGSKLVKLSRERACKEWGISLTADAEVQIEEELGATYKEMKPSLNSEDKSVVIDTIEATAAGFSRWHRKMETEMRSWSPEKKNRAKLLLEPMASAYARL